MRMGLSSHIPLVAFTWTGILILGLCLTACTTSVQNLERLPSFSKKSVGSRGLIVGTVTSSDSFNPLDEKAEAKRLRDELTKKHYPRFKAECLVDVIESQALEQFPAIAASYRTQGHLEPEDISALRLLLAERTEYVVFARLEEDQLTPAHETEEGYGEDGRHYTVYEADSSILMSFRIYDVNVGTTVWSGFFVQETTTAAKDYNPTIGTPALDMIGDALINPRPSAPLKEAMWYTYQDFARDLFASP
jgi:hypothetical protein